MRAGAEYQRIASLPRRDWQRYAPALASALTERFRTPHGTWTLRPAQAIALTEAAQCRGLVANIRVGGGKTLVSGLLPLMLGSKRPLLLLPAHLIDKTISEFNALRQHWQIPHHIRIVSYQRLGLAQYADLIETYAPDLIVCDEAHLISNPVAAVSKRVFRYLDTAPHCALCAMSGTLIGPKLDRVARIAAYALRERSPIPTAASNVETIAGIVDAVPNTSIDPQCLAPIVGADHCRTYAQAAAAYGARIRETPGVIVTQGTWAESGLELAAHLVETPAATAPLWEALRTEWIAPDGWPLADQRFEVYRVARQIALGFSYYHDPRPPEDWLDARRAWSRFCRETIAEHPYLDSEVAIIDAINAGTLRSSAWEPWQRIKPSHVPVQRVAWHSEHALQVAAKWAAKHGDGALIWAHHRAFGLRLSELTGIPYYQEHGRSAAGVPVESHRKGPAIVAAKANSTGRNLQHAFWRSLLVSPPASNTEMEQTIARTHRDGQQQSTVYVDYLLACREDFAAIDKAFRDCLNTSAKVGEQKLDIATHIELSPKQLSKATGFAWQ